MIVQSHGLTNNSGGFCLVSVPNPNQPKCRLLSVLHIILEAIYIPDEVWGEEPGRRAIMNKVPV